MKYHITNQEGHENENIQSLCGRVTGHRKYFTHKNEYMEHEDDYYEDVFCGKCILIFNKEREQNENKPNN